ncbi:MAG: amylo-alpha-1,6-glucosidase [Nitrospiraceae bacterium]|nr:amylo-alpha-1,6-glucosidase [Nitrospiraceae bacterium]
MPEPGKSISKYYIVASSTFIDPHRLIVKYGDTFGVFDRYGDIIPIGKGEQGLYHEGTRFLSRYEIQVNGRRPLFLSSNVDEDNIFLTVDLTNPQIELRGYSLTQDSVHIMRSRLLFDAQCLEYIRLRNFSTEPARFSLELLFDADLADIFEVRGFKRKKRGKMLESAAGDGGLTFSYQGLDGITRTTSIRFSRRPDRTKGKKGVSFDVDLKPGGTENIDVSIAYLSSDLGRRELDFREASRRAKKRESSLRSECASLTTSNQQFNGCLKRAVADIKMMLTETAYGPYPYGGIPWFSTPFGRDGIITAMECLWINPGIARGVLKYLASRQARDFDKAKAAEPGKILHEARKGELVNLGEIPFGLYYGSVDSTPLFLMLAHAYWKRTGDAELIKKLWEHIELSILWMENYGDMDGDGFLEYMPDRAGLINQGWKDSQDSVFHKDGSFPEGPIALCEVQGYAYAAKKGGAALAALLGKKNLAEKLLSEAGDLKENFNRQFWDDALGAYVLALDGRKKPCRVVASNAGHALFTSIAPPSRAKALADTLLSRQVFSGWGIRTVSAGEKLYNPISYHNGTVWPHDNALIAAGFARYGLKEQFNKVFSGLFEASLFMEFGRLPELFCGLHKRPGQAPTLYPVACTPQTWASGSLLLMLHAATGIEFDPETSTIVLRDPVLPGFLDYVSINNLPLAGKKSIDLRLSRKNGSVIVDVPRKPDDVHVVVYK